MQFEKAASENREWAKNKKGEGAVAAASPYVARLGQENTQPTFNGCIIRLCTQEETRQLSRLINRNGYDAVHILEALHLDIIAGRTRRVQRQLAIR